MANNKSRKNLKPWKKGQSGNPKGRPPVLPELRALCEQKRNEVKATLARLLNMDDKEFEEHSRLELSTTERILIKCIERIESDGDIRAAKELFEIVTGPLVDENSEDLLSEDEKYIIARWREEELKQNALNSTPGSPSNSVSEKRVSK